MKLSNTTASDNIPSNLSRSQIVPLQHIIRCRRVRLPRRPGWSVPIIFLANCSTCRRPRRIILLLNGWLVNNVPLAQTAAGVNSYTVADYNHPLWVCELHSYKSVCCSHVTIGWWVNLYAKNNSITKRKKYFFLILLLQCKLRDNQIYVQEIWIYVTLALR